MLLTIPGERMNKGGEEPHGCELNPRRHRPSMYQGFQSSGHRTECDPLVPEMRNFFILLVSRQNQPYPLDDRAFLTSSQLMLMLLFG